MAELYPRYERHAELFNVGAEGQQKLFNSSVLIVGVGGLGCPVALYLAAAGIGNITLMDDDEVRLTNLQRQILFKTQDNLEPKTQSAKKHLNDLNPDCQITALQERLGEKNAMELISKHDLVIDGSDNFKTRYLLNNAAFKAKKTLVAGAVLYFDGQVYVFKPYQDTENPCYKCLYPYQPESHEVPSCTESAVLGPVPGVIGTLMAVEIIKELLSIGDSLAGRFISYSGLSSQVATIQIKKNKNCEVCSNKTQ